MYAVVDTETTGISPKLGHRVVEVAVVLADSRGRVEDSWCTLVNPDRDLGPQRIHGIRAADVAKAPGFDAIAGHLMNMLSGRVLVAHNLPFDLTFLQAEYDRLGVPFPATRDLGLCTMTWARAFLPGAGRSLRECCSAVGLPLVGWHSALADAEAASRLLQYYIHAAGGQIPWADLVSKASTVVWPRLSSTGFQVCTRSDPHRPPSTRTDPLMARLVDYMPRVDSSEVADPYLAVLDQALADRYLSADENAALAALAVSLGLARDETTQLHQDYLDALARVALSDGQLTEDEMADLRQVAAILDLPYDAVDAALQKASASTPTLASGLSLEPGDMVVFTGDMGEPRELWLQRATDHGFVPHPAVTKKVRLVVAADTDSLSGKAKKARGYGIPIMSIDDFRSALGYPPPHPGQSAKPVRRNFSEWQWVKDLRGDGTRERW